MVLPINLDSLKVEWFINEASKLNPNDPRSNGYGYAVAVLVGVILLLVGNTIWKEKKRDKQISTLQREREAYRNDFKALVTSRFDELVKASSAANTELRAEFKSDIGAVRAEMQGYRNRVDTFGNDLSRLEGLLGRPRNRSKQE